MNLPGPYQQETIGQEQKGGWIALAFRSRPTFQQVRNAPDPKWGTMLEGSLPGNHLIGPSMISGWRAAVWDEVCSTTDGALLRTIKILITDGPQSEPEEDP
jgi:hypothetical protein